MHDTNGNKYCLQGSYSWLSESKTLINADGCAFDVLYLSKPDNIGEKQIPLTLDFNSDNLKKVADSQQDEWDLFIISSSRLIEVWIQDELDIKLSYVSTLRGQALEGPVSKCTEKESDGRKENPWTFYHNSVIIQKPSSLLQLRLKVFGHCSLHPDRCIIASIHLTPSPTKPSEVGTKELQLLVPSQNNVVNTIGNESNGIVTRSNISSIFDEHNIKPTNGLMPPNLSHILQALYLNRSLNAALPDHISNTIVNISNGSINVDCFDRDDTSAIAAAQMTAARLVGNPLPDSTHSDRHISDHHISNHHTSDHPFSSSPLELPISPPFPPTPLPSTSLPPSSLPPSPLPPHPPAFPQPSTRPPLSQAQQMREMLRAIALDLDSASTSDPNPKPPNHAPSERRCTETEGREKEGNGEEESNAEGKAPLSLSLPSASPRPMSVVGKANRQLAKTLAIQMLMPRGAEQGGEGGRAGGKREGAEIAAFLGPTFNNISNATSQSIGGPSFLPASPAPLNPTPGSTAIYQSVLTGRRCCPAAISSAANGDDGIQDLKRRMEIFESRTTERLDGLERKLDAILSLLSSERRGISN